MANKEKEMEQHSDELCEETIEDEGKGKKKGNKKGNKNKNEGKAEDGTDPSREELQERVNELEEEIGELKDKNLRLYAEFDNFRRRSAKERLEFTKTAGQEIIADMLPVMDDFERARKSIEEAKDVESLKEGFNLIFNKFQNTLNNKGLKPMDSMGKEFNSEIHEAITEIPAPKKELKGKVVDEIEKGYYLNDKIIRYAKVVVGK